jgi:excisionase family DNA binding protein
MTPPLTVDQAAAELGMSRRFIYREVSRGRLRLVKFGGATRILRSELDRYLRDAMKGRVA